MATSHSDNDAPFSPWRAALYVTLAVFIATLLLVAGGGWVLAPLPSEVKLPLLIVLAVVALLGSISLMVIAYGIFRLVNRDQPLGLPDGSVRAIIALMLIVLFAAMTVFLIVRLDMARADDPAVDVTKQVLTVLGTLVTAVASFYFGSKSVSEGLQKREDKGRPTDSGNQNEGSGDQGGAAQGSDGQGGSGQGGAGQEGGSQEGATQNAPAQGNTVAQPAVQTGSGNQPVATTPSVANPAATRRRTVTNSSFDLV